VQRSLARGAHEAVQLILGPHRLHRRQVGHLMLPRLVILAVQRVLATYAVRGFDREHRLHVLPRHQRPALALVTRLPPGLVSTGSAPPLRSARRGEIT
jgi:hypothetical protein